MMSGRQETLVWPVMLFGGYFKMFCNSTESDSQSGVLGRQSTKQPNGEFICCSLDSMHTQTHMGGYVQGRGRQ